MTLLKSLNGVQAKAPAEAPARSTTGRPGDPSADSGDARTKAAPANDMYGFFSIEDFPAGITDLTATHEDAQGFRDYVSQFATPNFWYQDGNVLSWAYGEQYDNWQDFYGFDACTVEYHSGHGTMDGDGVFRAPMGGTWGGDDWVNSADMRLGNEMARYLFWSTCLSLRVLDGHHPIRTWNAANQGWRMLFGFETVSIDSPNYGKFFFEEWNKNKSFSQAWLDASWRISTNQAPAASACGATQQEANDRLYNEHLFERAAASHDWWAWRWYYATRARARAHALPDDRHGAVLAPAARDASALAALGERFGITVRSRDDNAAARGLGLRFEDHGSGRSVALGPDGSREVRLAQVDGSAPRLSAEAAIEAADAAVRAFDLSTDLDLVFDRVVFDYHASGTAGEISESIVRSTNICYRQVVDGVPVVTPGAGEIRVQVDNTGTVVHVSDSTRAVAFTRDRSSAPTRMPATGERGGAGADARRGDGDASHEEALDRALQRRLRAIAAGGSVPREARAVPGSTEIGYAMVGNEVVPVARREVEIDMGKGLAKRYVLEARVGN